jgi:hypothetical protein
MRQREASRKFPLPWRNKKASNITTCQNPRVKI